GTIPSHLTINHAYNQTLTSMERFSRKITTVYMTGNVQHYLGYIFVSVVTLLGSSLIIQNAVVFEWQHVAPIELFEWVTGICIVVAAIYLLFSRSRITSIIAISAIGF